MSRNGNYEEQNEKRRKEMDGKCKDVGKEEVMSRGDR